LSFDFVFVPYGKGRDKPMSIFYMAYIILTSGLLLLFSPFFCVYVAVTGRYKHNIKERLGFLPGNVIKSLSGYPRIWIHAASLGEVKVASPIIKALRNLMPKCSIILSTNTAHGRNLAIETFGCEVPVVYAPVDFILTVRKALSSVSPDVMVFLETELWPGWLFEAHRMGIKTALVNGRISQRSIKRYLRLRPFFRDVLSNLDIFSMILDGDADRIKKMGAVPEKIEINGNAKYDLLTTLICPSLKEETRQALNLKESQRVIVAGSTRNGEEEIILDAYEKVLRQFSDTVLIIVPRHIERARFIGSLIGRRGLGYQCRTGIGRGKANRTENVLIVDTFGELFKIYSIATIVFCGASLVSLGGQNPLEPAAWGKVVFYGPSMDNFLDAKTLLEDAGAGVQVSGAREMAEKVTWFFNRPHEIKSYGERARESVIKNRAAAEKHATVIYRLLYRR